MAAAAAAGCGPAGGPGRSGRRDAQAERPQRTNRGQSRDRSDGPLPGPQIPRRQGGHVIPAGRSGVLIHDRLGRSTTQVLSGHTAHAVAPRSLAGEYSAGNVAGEPAARPRAVRPLQRGGAGSRPLVLARACRIPHRPRGPGPRRASGDRFDRQAFASWLEAYDRRSYEFGQSVGPGRSGHRRGRLPVVVSGDGRCSPSGHPVEGGEKACVEGQQADGDAER